MTPTQLARRKEILSWPEMRDEIQKLVDEAFNRGAVEALEAHERAREMVESQFAEAGGPK